MAAPMRAVLRTEGSRRLAPQSQSNDASDAIP
jgi:hypothetical protein